MQNTCSINVNHPHSTSDYDRRNVWVLCNPTECWTGIDDAHEYIDTHFGTFRRHVCYWLHSPYGWEAVNWS